MNAILNEKCTVYFGVYSFITNSFIDWIIGAILIGDFLDALLDAVFYFDPTFYQLSFFLKHFAR
jgi:hypothetical protein